MRPRTRKDRDRDRESDTQSISATSSISTLKEHKDRKHRKSFTSHPGSSADNPSQITGACNDATLDELPPPPETEESESASASNSPIMRTTSNASNSSKRSHPAAIDTPARLQPYLEESEDTASVILAPNRTAESSEWIGPRMCPEESGGEPLDALTPKPQDRDDPMDTGDQSHAKGDSNKPHAASSDAAAQSDKDSRRISFADSNHMVFPWGGETQLEQYVHPSQMFNPFLQPGHHPGPAQGLEQNNPSVETKNHPPDTKPAPLTPPPQPAPPTKRPAGRPHITPDLRQEIRPEYPPPARIEYARLPPPHPPQPPQSPPLPNMHMNPGYLVPVAPALSPVPMHHTQSSPLPQPNIQPVMDHPAHLMHRIGSALPDIAALMEIYRGTCYALYVKDNHIHEIENQKAIQSENLHSRIDGLTKEIQSILRIKDADRDRLTEEIERWETKHSKLSEAYVKERRHKEDAINRYTNLKNVHEQSKKSLKEEISHLSTSFAEEKERMNVIYSGERQSLMDQLQQSHTAQESLIARIKDLEISHSEKEVLELQWQQRIQDMQNEHAKAKESWQKETQIAVDRLDAEMNSINRTAEGQRKALINQHQSEVDDMQRLANEKLRQQEMNAEKEVKKHQRQNEDSQHRVKELEDSYNAQIQETTETFRKEKEEYSRVTEAATARQVAELQHEIDDMRAWKTAPTSRESSQSRDLLKVRGMLQNLEKEKEDLSKARKDVEERQAHELREAQATADKLREENAKLARPRGPSQTRQLNEARETIARLQKENESLKADRPRLAKPKIEEPSVSRSSTPVPPGEKLERTRSHRTSGIFGISTGNKGRSGGGEPHGRGESGRDDGHRSHHLRERTS